MGDISIIMRHETRPSERRAPIVPADAARLVERGVAVTVEDSPRRAFRTADYAAAGCAVAAPGSWVDAPGEAIVLGLKELPGDPPALRHRHVFFGHAYKGQPAGPALLRRFAAGGGSLLDLEYLVDDAGRRLAAFGYWAGYTGAALAVLAHRGRLAAPLRPVSRAELDAELRRPAPGAPRALVIGALGRCGRGARAALELAGVEVTRWDLAETAELDTAALLDHDILVNAVLVSAPTPPFVTRELLARPGRRLATVVDVTCDAGSALNVVPLYDRPTSWTDPVLTLDAGGPVSVIAIDNLPSLLPYEASTAFSADLTPHLPGLAEPSAPWRRALAEFDSAVSRAVSKAGPKAGPMAGPMAGSTPDGRFSHV